MTANDYDTGIYNGDTGVVVNIDGGFNGGHAAALIARRAGLARAGASPSEQA